MNDKVTGILTRDKEGCFYMFVVSEKSPPPEHEVIHSPMFAPRYEAQKKAGAGVTWVTDDGVDLHDVIAKHLELVGPNKRIFIAEVVA